MLNVGRFRIVKLTRKQTQSQPLMRAVCEGSRTEHSIKYSALELYILKGLDGSHLKLRGFHRVYVRYYFNTVTYLSMHKTFRVLFAMFRL
jgi:hypothetical protein